MQQLLVLATCLALANGLALYANYPYLYTAQGTALITPTQQQYLTQDALGQYAYGYAEPHSSKQEIRSLDGTTRGTYSYRDATGKLQTVDYTADAEGFHVAATNLPHAVKPQKFQPSAVESRSVNDVVAPATAEHPADSIEVAAARQTHLAAHEEARLRLAPTQQHQQSSQSHPDVELPRPVADTAEVAAAKSIHLKRVASEKLRNELLSVPAVSAVPVARSSHVIVPVPAVYGYTVPRYYSSRYIYYQNQVMMQFLQLCLLMVPLVHATALLDYGAPPSADTVSQYHSQDEHGQYAYGYTAPLYSKHETRTADGVTHGSYSYVDATGQKQTVDYKADVDGFRVTASSLQQRPNEETPEVAALRAQHLAAHAEAKLRLAAGNGATSPQDTPEVAAAKVAFFKRFEAEKLHNQLKSKILPSHTILSQPIYVYQPESGIIYKYNHLLRQSRDYLPVA
ncbi:uncharacterized protein LOC117786907 [Drosophila innubila]|uniref:uncharacterized protein LOC117786907 n=1 Tax=Drosophila innubila TaxID=198719 RepID=UPI00148B67D9|nr:uncharacterized protein LOC117786907 [Drosophila innubila]